MSQLAVPDLLGKTNANQISVWRSYAAADRGANLLFTTAEHYRHALADWHAHKQACAGNGRTLQNGYLFAPCASM